MAALLQRGERAYQAFMAALLQKGYSAVFHAIHETSNAPSGSDEEEEYLSDRENDNVMESDEEIKAETLEIAKRNSLTDELLRGSTSSRDFGTDADEALLKRSSDLMNIDHVSQLPAHTDGNARVSPAADNRRKTVNSDETTDNNISGSDINK